jgi:hypothetical protein
MTFKSALYCSVAAMAAMALTAGGADAAATKKKHVAAPAAPSELSLLREQIAALQAKVEALSAAQAKSAEDAAALETNQDALATSMVAQSEGINTMPAKIQKDVLAAVPKPKPPWADNTTVSGRMYYNLSNVEQKTSTQGKIAPTGTAFEIKRFYLGVDHKFNDMFSANLTTDARYNNVEKDGLTRTSSSNAGSNSGVNDVQVYIKKAYLQAKINDYLTVRAGAADMPWIPFVDEQYGYRFIDKTLLENRYTFGNSTDWGVHALGKYSYFSYAVSVVNGAGYRNPSRSAGLDVEGRLSATVPTVYGTFTGAIGGYSGKLGKEQQQIAPAGNNAVNTAQRSDVLLNYTSGPIRIGGEYFTAKNWANNGVTTTFPTRTLKVDKSEGSSIWASYQITPMVSVFGKSEYVEPSKAVIFPNNIKKDQFFHVGVNFEPVKIVDLALVYKHDKVNGNNAPTTAPAQSATYNEVGLYGQLRW